MAAAAAPLLVHLQVAWIQGCLLSGSMLKADESSGGASCQAASSSLQTGVEGASYQTASSSVQTLECQLSGRGVESNFWGQGRQGRAAGRGLLA